MDEARGIEHKIKAPLESSTDTERNGLREVNSSPNNNRCNNESHQENSIPNVNLRIFIYHRYRHSFLLEMYSYVIINMNVTFISFRHKKLMK